jgi:8-oxo-dGTP pyrophosphatase MutT (NUDIX family)
MTQVGDDSYSPEMVFIFGTVFVVRFNRKKQSPELLWVLQKDRAKQKLWTPPGGEWLVPKKIKKGKFMEISKTGIREVKEEVGVDVRIMGCGPFWECLIPNSHPRFHVQITISERIKRGESVSCFYKHGAHSLILYYLGQIIEGEPICMKQPNEKDCEIIKLRWLSISDSLRALNYAGMKTYPSILVALRRLDWLISQKTNPWFSSNMGI